MDDQVKIYYSGDSLVHDVCWRCIALIDEVLSEQNKTE